MCHNYVLNFARNNMILPWLKLKCRICPSDLVRPSLDLTSQIGQIGLSAMVKVYQGIDQKGRYMTLCRYKCWSPSLRGPLVMLRRYFDGRTPGDISSWTLENLQGKWANDSHTIWPQCQKHKMSWNEKNENLRKTKISRNDAEWHQNFLRKTVSLSLLIQDPSPLALLGKPCKRHWLRETLWKPSEALTILKLWRFSKMENCVGKYARTIPAVCASKLQPNVEVVCLCSVPCCAWAFICKARKIRRSTAVSCREALDSIRQFFCHSKFLKPKRCVSSLQP